MTTTTKPRAWNHNSQVVCCEFCDGLGVIHSQRKATTEDPYPEQPCENCDGPHEPECEVCGYDLVVSGYDCLVCDTVSGLITDEFAAFDVGKFAAALTVAVKARAGA